MSASAIVAALAIPPDARIDQRVPKKLLSEQGAPTATDRRQIQDGIEEITWVAALKPANTGVPAYRDAEREYIEVHVLSAMLRPTAKAPRLVELIHRAIPYPLALIATQGSAVSFSLAHKRFSQAERTRVVVDGAILVAPLSQPRTSEEDEFLASLQVVMQPASDLRRFYQGWCDRVTALEAARLIGAFALPVSVERAAERRAALDDCARLHREVASLRAQAATERQLSRRVEINLRLKDLEAKLAELQGLL